MATRIVDVAGFDLVTGHMAHSELRCSAQLAPAAVRAQFAAASLDASSAVAADATAERVVGASRSTTVSLSAAATVAPAVSLDDALETSPAYLTPATLAIPDEDVAYKVTVSPTTLPTGYAVIVVVSFPLPANQSTSHWITVDYTVSGSNRRIAHDIFTASSVGAFANADGVVVEPNPTAGETSRIRYVWSPTDLRWTVDTYSANCVVRDHEPDTSLGITVSFTPELRADEHAADHIAWTMETLEYVHPTTRTLLASRNVWADVTSRDSDGLMESLAHRDYVSGSSFSGLSGITTGPFPVAKAGVWSATPGGYEAKTILHEMGHALDMNWLKAIGEPQGFNRSDAFTLDEFWEDGVTLHYRYFFVGYYELYRLDTYDESGVFVSRQDFEHSANTNGLLLSGETELVDLFTPIQNAGVYYRSTVREWFAEMCACYWYDTAGLYPAGAISVATGGDSSIYDDFVTYMQGIGAFPT